MARLGPTIDALSQSARLWTERLNRQKAIFPDLDPAADRLQETLDFGANPGALRMFGYAPPDLPAAPALVVALHGCTQTAAGYDVGTGWSTLADRYGFVLLLPEQRRANNPQTCFSWFVPGDTRRGEGEAQSIREMIERTVLEYGIDRSRIFVTGLSAGGAMTGVMLAAYPEVFAGGAIIAGLPYGGAGNVSEALAAMSDGRARSAEAWGDLVRAASPHPGPWPKISVWHGSADSVVRPLNADEIIKQWTDVHGVSLEPNWVDEVNGHKHRVWTDQAGDALIEEYVVAGMGHGVPLATDSGEDQLGVAGPFLLEAGISSSDHIARFWGLATPDQPRTRRANGRRVRKDAKRAPRAGAPALEMPEPTAGSIEAIITEALRKAGLVPVEPGAVTAPWRSSSRTRRDTGC